MKSIYNKIILLSFLAFLATSCESFKDKEIENGIMIDGLALNKITEITVEDDGYIHQFSPRLTVAQSENVVIRLAVDEDYLAEYNYNQNKTYVIVPDERYQILTDSVLIRAGELTPTAPFEVLVQNVGDIVDLGTYALPLAITSDSEEAEMISGYDKFLLRVTSPRLVNYPISGTDTSVGESTIYFQIGDDDTYPWFSDTMTVEFNIAQECMQKTTGYSGEYMMYIAVLKWNLRHGDTSYDARQTNLSIYGDSYLIDDEQYYFPDNEWVHLAVAYTPGICNFYRNGVLMTTLISSKTFDLQKFNWYVSSNQNRYNGDRAISEFRIWSCIRTQDQIIDNRWSVPANSDNLEFYWKLNEGEGRTFYESARKHTYVDAETGETKYWDCTAERDVTWILSSAVEEEAPFGDE